MFDGICMVLITVSILACFFGCQGHNSDSASLGAAVIGTWTSSVVKGTELGTGKTEITFNADGKVRVTTLVIDDAEEEDLNDPDYEPMEEESMTVEGTYKIEGGKLVSDVFNKGKPIQIWLDSGSLILKLDDDSPSRWTRKR